MSAAPAELGAVRIGETGVVMSRLVLGTAPLAGLFAPVTAEDAEVALAAASEVGITTFDTAPHYGAGLAEERLGAYVAGRPRDAFVVSTKVGRLLIDTDGEVDGEGFFGAPRRRRIRDYSRAGVRKSLEASLGRLGLDYIDLLLIHDPDDYGEIAFGETVDALYELRAAGVVGAIGVGMNEVAMLERFVDETDIDAVLVAGRYSLLDNSAATRLLPRCRERGVAVIAGGVYNSGILAKPGPGATFNYVAAPSDVLARVEAIGAHCDRHGVALPAAALHYVLANDAVSAVVIGARSAAEVRENAEHFATVVPPALYFELAGAGLIAPIAGSR